jgi:hypothetical protein
VLGALGGREAELHAALVREAGDAGEAVPDHAGFAVGDHERAPDVRSGLGVHAARLSGHVGTDHDERGTPAR